MATIAAKVGRRLRRKGLARAHPGPARAATDDRSVRSVQRQLAGVPATTSWPSRRFCSAWRRKLWRPGTPVRLLGVATTGRVRRRPPAVQESLFDVAEAAPGGWRTWSRPSPKTRRKRRGLIEATDAREGPASARRPGPLRPRAARRGQHHRLRQQEPGRLQVRRHQSEAGRKSVCSREGRRESQPEGGRGGRAARSSARAEAYRAYASSETLDCLSTAGLPRPPAASSRSDGRQAVGRQATACRPGRTGPWCRDTEWAPMTGST